MPPCLRWVGGVEEEALSCYQSLMFASQGRISAGYSIKVDEGAVKDAPYNDDAIDALNDAGKAIGKADRRLVERYLKERRKIYMPATQKRLISGVAYRLALHFGLCN